VLWPDLFSISSVFNWRMIFLVPLAVVTYFSMKYLAGFVRIVLRRFITA
jgi:hypothetical protein